MSRVVIDASVYVSRLRAGELYHAASTRFFEALLAHQVEALCPQIALPEVAAALARGLDDSDPAERAAAQLRLLPYHRFYDVDGELASRATRLAAQCRLRGCDAIYAALAQREGVPLVTWDRQQLERAPAALTVWTPAEALASLAG